MRLAEEPFVFAARGRLKDTQIKTDRGLNRAGIQSEWMDLERRIEVQDERRRDFTKRRSQKTVHHT